MTLHRAHYHATIDAFLDASADAICGMLASRSGGAVEPTQLRAWQEQVSVLQPALMPYGGQGHVFFEFVLPRIGRRVDVILVINHLVLVVEFKAGEKEFHRHAIDQVWDYALDLKNFHEPSHAIPLVPVLIATEADSVDLALTSPAHDGVYEPVRIGRGQLGVLLSRLTAGKASQRIDGLAWGAGRYSPTPTIVEAARALYGGHSVADISRSDAGASNLTRTSRYLNDVIASAQEDGRKAICLLTGLLPVSKTPC